MSWNLIRQASLKLRVLGTLLPVMVLVAGASLWLTRADASASANAAYDRSLLGAIKSLDLNVSTESGGLSVELPYRLFEFFQLTATGNVYYRVASSDGLVEIGNTDLPMPPGKLLARQPVFYDASYFGEPVRVGAYMRPVDAARAGPADPQVVIQVAESTASRVAFTDGFLRRAAVRDALLLAVMVLAVAAGLALALRPVARLALQTRTRAVDDLRALQTTDLPRDLVPLVDAVNQQIARTARLVDERRAFVDDASHQLRTPLAVLRAQVDYALREPDPLRREQALHALSDELGQAIRGTNQLLTLASSEAASAPQERFDLCELTRGVAIELLPLARTRGIDLGVDAPEAAQWAEGQATLLRHALLNIAHNAIQHGRAQGVVTLQVASDADGHSLRVCDDGPGLAPEILPRLGQRFAKSRGSRGSGLGLAIARSVIEQHGGQLRVEPAAGGAGLCVSLWWPRS